MFNNIPIANRLDPLFDANLMKLEAVRKYGPPGAPTLAYNAYIFTVKWGRESIMWGLLPEWFWYFPTKFCKWAVVPHLKWIGCNIHIPLSVMSFLRYGAWYSALLIGAFELADLANGFYRAVEPIFDGPDTPSTYKELLAKQKARKYSLFFEYEEFHPGYKPLYFIYRPIAWAFLATDKYRLLPIWSRLSRVGKVEVKTITRSKYHMGMKVIVGGTRIRYPGVIGSKQNLQVSEDVYTPRETKIPAGEQGKFLWTIFKDTLLMSLELFMVI